MKIDVKPFADKTWKVNDDFQKPLFDLLGDMLIAGKGPKFRIGLNHSWVVKLEGEYYEFITGDTKYTLKERLQVCSFLCGIRYDKKIPSTEIRLEEVK